MKRFLNNAYDFVLIGWPYLLIAALYLTISIMHRCGVFPSPKRSD